MPWPTAEESLKHLKGSWSISCVPTEDAFSHRYDIEISEVGEFEITRYHYTNPQCRGVVRDFHIFLGQLTVMETSSAQTLKIHAKTKGPHHVGDWIAGTFFVSTKNSQLIVRPIEAEIFSTSQKEVRSWDREDAEVWVLSKRPEYLQ